VPPGAVLTRPDMGFGNFDCGGGFRSRGVVSSLVTQRSRPVTRRARRRLWGCPECRFRDVGLGMMTRGVLRMGEWTGRWLALVGARFRRL
jgi:hypothetical protein